MRFSLYGFLSSREKHFFEMLLSASGVGPSLALKILSGMSVEELVPAIRGSDLARLTKIPGVGRKTAERIVVELKDKLDAVTIEVERPAASSPAGIDADVVSALVNLGYEARAAEGAVAEARRENGDRQFREVTQGVVAILKCPKGTRSTHVANGRREKQVPFSKISPCSLCPIFVISVLSI